MADYADSAQARQTDAGYQEEQPRFANPDRAAQAAFDAEVKAARERDAIKARERLKRALGELEVFFGERK